MSYHKGNAYLANVTAASLRTTWVNFVTGTLDQYATFTPEPENHNRYFNTRHFVVVSVNARVTFGQDTPDYHNVTSLSLPSSLRVKADTVFHEQCVVERYTGVEERKYALGYLIADGTERGGADGLEYVALDRLKVESFGAYVAGQTYTVRGQIAFQAAA